MYKLILKLKHYFHDHQLGGAVTEQRGVLERALRHSRKIQKDSSHLEEWLSTTECELDQHEATVPTKNVQGEVHFAQVCYLY